MTSRRKKVTKKKVVEKPYNSGTMTKSAFFSMIRSSLRKASRWWKPVQQCKDEAKRKYNGVNKKQRWEYKCAKCNNYFKDKDISVDHIIECGSLNNFDDIGDFCKRLFVEANGLQVLCKQCHDEKTKLYRNQIKINKQNV